MTVFTLGEAAALAIAGARPRKAARSGSAHRTEAPVRRGSVEAGTFEDLFFAAPAKGETDRLLRTARAALDTARRLKRVARVEGRELSAGERAIAALTAGAVRVYEELLTLARLNCGRVYPSYDHLAEVTALGRATIARALRVLENAGFLVRQRRFRRIKNEGPGPRWEQTSNAYRPTLPQRILKLLPRRLRPAPVPDDMLQREADRQEEVGAMLDSLSCREFASITASGALGSALARLGAVLDRRIDDEERESHNGPEPLLESFAKGSQNELA